jgi:hypothetical protein
MAILPTSRSANGVVVAMQYVSGCEQLTSSTGDVDVVTRINNRIRTGEKGIVPLARRKRARRENVAGDRYSADDPLAPYSGRIVATT